MHIDSSRAPKAYLQLGLLLKIVYFKKIMRNTLWHVSNTLDLAPVSEELMSQHNNPLSR